MSNTVTVSIIRQVDPEQADRMVAWINAGASLAERFPGYLGMGWVRSGVESSRWHMLFRFESQDLLDAWSESEQRRWWLDAAQGIAEATFVEQRTGIEGWFDDPTSQDVADLRPGPKAPPRWKQGIVIWMAFFPLSLLTTWLLTFVLPTDFNLVLRVLLSTFILTPIMTYFALPGITSAMSWWLQGQPAPWRKERQKS
ncbi:antibiotic biosynthesis monooxygenase [Ornithinimicrobium sp. INDO-MA30-4]|uniref:antibiotic biosynthesis monooxygenase n=1 Tax=Ornithinimicrobium sp. INDO-MA30-4 TaxID=2908651 RepID=UPI001F4681CE|nr:antibiotic biosynthesis monooxygenase [Ornithinimicrobium sp. INDO-MA30-4]UJH70906.1 antibiotic biosynthesis monooxygenase [Ornithinimicrobium sp. INDO-MA30-4]